MIVTIKYFLKIEKITNKKIDQIHFEETKTLRELLVDKIGKEKIGEIEKSQIIITKNGKSCKNLDVIVENDDIFCLCPAIYGG